MTTVSTIIWDISDIPRVVWLVGHQEPFTGSELLEMWTDTSVSPMTQRQQADVQREPLAAFPSQRGALYASR